MSKTDLAAQVAALLRITETDNTIGRAAAVGVTIPQLPGFLDKLRGLGLVDAHQRVTRAGIAYALIAERGAGSGTTDARVWRAVGGTRESVDQVLNDLQARRLIVSGEVRAPASVDPAMQAYWQQREAAGETIPAVEEGDPEQGWVAQELSLDEA